MVSVMYRCSEKIYYGNDNKQAENDSWEGIDAPWCRTTPRESPKKGKKLKARDKAKGNDLRQCVNPSIRMPM